MGIAILDIPITSSAIPTYIKEGDTIPKIELEFDGGVDLTTSTIKMQVYDGNTKILDLSDGSGITVTGALTCEIDEISYINNPFRAGVFLGDLEILDVLDKKRTHFDVRYTIIKQYTK